MRIVWRAAWILPAALIFISGGCQKQTRSEQRALRLNLQENILDPLKLRGDLTTFGHEFHAAISSAASTIASAASDRNVRELALRWKMVAIPAMDLVTLEPDPREAFVVAWIICEKQCYFFSHGRGKSLFGDQQQAALVAMVQLRDRILEIGRSHFGEDLIERGEAEIEKIAENFPLAAMVEEQNWIAGTPAGGQSSQGSGMVSTILGMPLAPFRGFEGVGDTPSAIKDFSSTARALGAMVKSMPERIRWETEMLLYEIESLDTVVKLRENLDSASRSMESLAKTAEGLPAQVRKEAEAALASAEASQEKLRGTLQEARKAMEDLNGVLAKAEGVAKEVQGVSAGLAKTAAAWESTAGAVNGVLRTYQEIASPKEKDLSREEKKAEPEEKGKGPTGVQAYTEMAERIRAGAEEVRGLLEDLESGKLKVALDGVGESSRTSIDHATENAGGLIDRIAIRAAILIGMTLAAIAILRLLFLRLQKR